jgi:hypothetical protein
MSQPRLPPYLIAGGRTQPTMPIAIETLVERTASWSESSRFEARRVLDLAREPISVAEVSASMKIPLGTTRVLVSDLLDAGALLAHETTEQSEVSDLDIMTRIISRVRDL